MNQRDLPERWKIRIKAYLADKESPYEKLGAEDFPANTVTKLSFTDGSYAKFKYAMILELPEFNEVGVFTEHCGYHIFNAYGLEINTVEQG